MNARAVPGDELQNPLANSPTSQRFPALGPEQERIFRQSITTLDAAGIPFLIAGAFACHAHSGAWRNTKDLDLFLLPDDVHAALDALAAAGFEIELRDPHWLAKAWKKGYLIDLIFGMGNRAMPIDESWIERATMVDFCGTKARLLSIEDLIASKMYIAARDRFDGADLAHLILSRRGRLDWERVLELMGESRGLVLWHLLLFAYLYPDHRDILPLDLMDRLVEEARREWRRGPGQGRRSRGPLLDPVAFAVDIQDWGYEDPRPEGRPIRPRGDA
jgi:predicted nucleotidyltransferase